MGKSLYRIQSSSCGCNNTQQAVTVVQDTTGGVIDTSPKMTALKFVISADGTGVTDASFDGYKPAGNTLTDLRLVGARIAVIVVSGVPVYDYGQDGNQLAAGTIDFTPSGGLSVGAKVTILYTP